MNSCPSLRDICLDKIMREPEYYGRRLQRETPADQSIVNNLCRRVKKVYILPPSTEKLMEKGALVHATNFVPKGKILKAGTSIKYGDQQLFLSCRKTVHFAAHLVQPHSVSLIKGFAHSWEDRKYAFIVPLNPRQLVHLFPADTFSLGDFELPEETICVTRFDDRAALIEAGWPEGKLRVYSNQTLREAISSVLIEEKKWVIHKKPGQGSTGMYARIPGGPYRYFDLSASYFWSNLLENKDFPISFGPAMQTYENGYGGLVKAFDVHLFGFTKSFYDFGHIVLVPPDIPEKEEILLYLEIFPRILAWENFQNFLTSRLPQTEIDDLQAWTYYTLQLMSLDLKVRDLFGLYLSIAYDQTPPSEYLEWKKELFNQAKNTPQKNNLLDPSHLEGKFVELCQIFQKLGIPIKDDQEDNLEDSPKQSLFRKKIDLFYFYGEDQQVAFLSHFPRPLFDELLCYLNPCHSKEHAESLPEYALLCYFLNRYFLSLDEKHLQEFGTQIKKIQTSEKLATAAEVFKRTRMKHPKLYSHITQLFDKIDPSSNGARIVDDFKKYFDVRHYFNLPGMEHLTLEDLNLSPYIIDSIGWKQEKLNEYLNKDEKNLEFAFYRLESDLEWERKKHGDDSQVFLFWNLKFPKEFTLLNEWLQKLPSEYPRVGWWKEMIANAQKKIRHMQRVEQHNKEHFYRSLGLNIDS